jgi:hypothetical protein
MVKHTLQLRGMLRTGAMQELCCKLNNSPAMTLADRQHQIQTYDKPHVELCFPTEWPFISPRLRLKDAYYCIRF